MCSFHALPPNSAQSVFMALAVMAMIKGETLSGYLPVNRVA